MLSWNILSVSVVLSCVVGHVELHADSFESSFRAGLFSSRSQDDDDLFDTEVNMEGESRIIAMLSQIIRDMKLKYAPEALSYAPETLNYAPQSQSYAHEFQYYAPVSESNTPSPPSPSPSFAPDFTYHFPQIDLSLLDFSALPFAARPNEPQFYQTDYPSNKKQMLATANGNPPRSASNSRTPRPRLSPPVIVLVKEGSMEDQRKDVTQVHSNHPHLQGHPSKLHHGHPKWETDEETGDSHVFITKEDDFDDDNMYFIALVAGCSAALLLVIALGVTSWYKLQRNTKLGADVKYPAHSVTKNGTPPSNGDRRLAHSAQMYHYQHQKQQILALENNSRDQRRGSLSDADSDDEHDADYTVYECPTLPMTNKKTPDIEVKKPTVETKPTPSLPSSNTSEDNSQNSQTK